MTIRLCQQKFPRPVSRPVVDNKKTFHPYVAMMIKVLWQTQHFVAHRHESSYFIPIIANESVINTKQRMLAHVFLRQLCHPYLLTAAM